MRSVKRAAHRDRDEALRLIRLLVNHLQRSARTIERRTGVTNAQLFLLQTLHRLGPLSVRELAGQARTDQSTASLVTQRLVQARLARKARSRRDGRQVQVTLTPRARILLRRAPVPPTASLLRAIRRLQPGDARALVRGLHTLVRSIRPAPHAPAILFEHPSALAARVVRRAHR